MDTALDVPPNKRLRVSQVKPITLQRYSNAVCRLEEWARSKHRSLGPSRADHSIVAFLHELCESGAPIGEGRSVVYGFIMLRCNSSLPEKHLLAQSKSALKGWSSRYPTHSKAGVDLRIWDVIASQCLMDAETLVAAAILLQGDLYLRPSELLQLRRKDVLTPRQSKASFYGVVVGSQEGLTPTKTGTWDDCVLADTPSRLELSSIFKYLLKHATHPDDLLFSGLSLAAYEQALRSATSQLGLASLRLTPHVLRHSGPSHDLFHKIRDSAQVQQRGRWRTQASVARYAKPGRMLLLHQQVPSEIWEKAPQARADVIRFFSSIK